MLIPIQLSQEQDVFNTLTNVFEDAERAKQIDGFDARDEQDGYGNDGYITIKIDGRTFNVSLEEIVY